MSSRYLHNYFPPVQPPNIQQHAAGNATVGHLQQPQQHQNINVVPTVVVPQQKNNLVNTALPPNEYNVVLNHQQSPHQHGGIMNHSTYRGHPPSKYKSCVDVQLAPCDMHYVANTKNRDTYISNIINL